MKRRRGRGEEKKREGKRGKKEGGEENLFFHRGSIYFLRTQYYSETFDAARKKPTWGFWIFFSL